MTSFSGIFAASSWKKAAGDLVLIVVGVTIALWADAWVGERSDRRREHSRLDALYADTSETLAALAAARRDASAAADALRRILKLQAPYESLDDVAGLLRHGLLFGSDFYPEMSVYEDLKSAGELALLTNPGLRRALSRMEAGLEQLRLATADLTTVQQLNIDSYMVDHIDLRSLYGQSTGVERSDASSHPDFEFVADHEFQNRILLKLDLVTHLEMKLKDAESRLLSVKRTIEADLGK